MSRFEKIDGYNSIKDNEDMVYTLAEYEPKEYQVGEFSLEDLLNLLNQMDSEIKELKAQLEEDK